MLTCIIQYRIDPYRHELFEQYARNWNVAIPRCGAELVGYFKPHEGSTTLAYGIYHIDNLAHYEQYRQRLMEDPLGQANYEFAVKERFIQSEERTFLEHVPSQKITP